MPHRLEGAVFHPREVIEPDRIGDAIAEFVQSL
jgi:hypothetical protein